MLVADSVSSIADLVKAHAATLGRIWIHASTTTQTDPRHARETWKDVLRAAMLCPNLGELLLKVELARVGIGIYAINLSLDEDRVATTLANLVEGPHIQVKNWGGSRGIGRCYWDHLRRRQGRSHTSKSGRMSKFFGQAAGLGAVVHLQEHSVDSLSFRCHLFSSSSV